MLSVRLPKELEKKLERLSKITKRSKSFFVKEALENQLEDLEDFYAALDILSKANSKYYTTEEIEKSLNYEL
ncbi:MAG: ribbon-helix-helix protein, CopG family [Armatimonadetes bacterium]|nr:ribbon-helix-helix protein, CopG family [Armatimonadota bacterium]